MIRYVSFIKLNDLPLKELASVDPNFDYREEMCKQL